MLQTSITETVVMIYTSWEDLSTCTDESNCNIIFDNVRYQKCNAVKCKQKLDIQLYYLPDDAPSSVVPNSLSPENLLRTEHANI